MPSSRSANGILQGICIHRITFKNTHIPTVWNFFPKSFTFYLNICRILWMGILATILRIGLFFLSSSLQTTRSTWHVFEKFCCRFFFCSIRFCDVQRGSRMKTWRFFYFAHWHNIQSDIYYYDGGSFFSQLTCEKNIIWSESLLQACRNKTFPLQNLSTRCAKVKKAAEANKKSTKSSKDLFLSDVKRTKNFTGIHRFTSAQ